jgi:uncharacterized protein (DUF58 family)
MHALIRDCWPPSTAPTPRAQRLHLGPGERAVLRTTLLPERRGERRVDAVAVRSIGPLGLAARQRNRPLAGALRVLPAFTSRRYLPEKLARLRQLDGQVVAPVRGHGSEFDALREYVVGDDARSIDWRATARRADVVVRTWRPERDRQLLLVLDCGRSAAARVDGAPRLDTAIDGCLLLTALAQRAGDRVGVLAFDRALRAAAEAGKGPGGIATVVDAVAGLEAALVETDLNAAAAHAIRRLRRRSLVVLFTTLEPAIARDGLLPAAAALAQRHVVLVAGVRDSAETALVTGRGSADAVYAAAAAQAARSERAAVAATLRRHGVSVVEAEPASFASSVADTYLALKAEGRL